MAPSRWIASFVCFLAAAACGSSAPPAGPVGPPGAAKLAAVSSRTEELAGVDASELSSRERADWSRLVTQMIAPCKELAATIAECVDRQLPCPTCAPAARLVATKIHDGMAATDVEAAVKARFESAAVKAEPLDSPARGPANAAVTIVVWSDFQCPACGYSVPLLNEIVEKHSDRVRLVHKFYPLRQHPDAQVAAQAAVAAKNQGKYWEMEALLFDHQSALDRASIEQYASDLHLDLPRFRADMDAPTTKQMIERDKEQAIAAGLEGTPFIVVNGRVFDSDYFKVATDLEPWIELEVELASRASK